MTTSMPPAPAARDDSTLLPVLVGAGVGLLGGVAWAAIVALTDYEIGYVAWGIGALIGYAMARTTPQRSTELAVIAAVIALTSLLVGKVLIQHFVTGPAFRQSLRDSPEAVGAAAAWGLREEHAFPPPLQARLDSLSEADTLSDSLWEQMVAAGHEHARTLPDTERAQLAEHYAATVGANVGPWQQLRWGFSPWDLLWFGLAISTAWRLLRSHPVTAAGEGG
jgi:hypothetical protein